MIAGTLEIQMTANIARISKDIADAKRVVNEGMESITKSAETAKRALEAVGIGIGAVEFAGLIKGAADSAEHLLNLQKATGLTVEALAGLKLLAKQNGTDIDSLAKGIEKLSVNMGKAPADFKALGVSAKDPLVAFGQLADIFKLIPDIQTRNAVTMKALGKSWAEVAAVMSLGSEEIAKTVAKGAELSHMNTDLAKQSKEFNDKWVELTGTGGFLNQMLAALLPTMNGVADDFIHLKEGSGGSATAFQAMGNAVASSVTVTKDAVIWLYTHKTAVEALAGAYLSFKLGGYVAELAKSAEAAYTQIAANMAARAALVETATANAAATGTTLALTTARVAELRAAVIGAEGEVALAVATNGLIPAQTRAAAAAIAHADAEAALALAQREASLTASAASSVIAGLGGPIGILITVLGMAATAWVLFGQKGKTAVDGLNDDIQRGLDIARQYQKDAQFGTGQAGQLEAALDAVNKKIDVVSQSHSPGAAAMLADLRAKAEQLQEALQKTIPAQAGLTDAQKAAAKAAEDFLKLGTEQASSDQINTYNTLVSRINQYNEQIKQQISAGRSLTEGEKIEIEIKQKLGAADQTALKASVDWMHAQEDAWRLIQETNKVEAETQKLRDKALADMERETASILDETQKMRDHNTEITLGKNALELLKIARDDATISTLQSTLAGIDETLQCSKEAMAIRDKIAALQDQKKALGETITANNLRQQMDEWKKFTDGIDRALTDALMRGFENGKGGSQAFIDSLKNSLKTAVFQIAVKAVLDPITGAMQAVVGGGSATTSQGLFGTTGGLSTLSAGGSLYNFATGNVGGGLYGAFANSSVGASLGLSTPGLMGPTVTGEALSGLTTLGTALPYVGAFVAAVSILSGLMGDGDAERSAQVSQYGWNGDNYRYQSNIGPFSPWSNNKWFSDSEMAPSEDAFAATITSLDNKLAAAISSSQLDAVRNALKSDTPTTIGFGMEHTDWTQSQAQDFILTERYRLELNAIQSGLGDLAAQGGITAQKIEDVVTQLQAMQSAPAKAVSAAQQNLAANLQSFFQLYYTQAEQQAQTQHDLAVSFAELNVALPQSKDELRAMITGIDLSNAAGQNLFAQLVALAPAFASVSDAAKAATSEANKLADAQRQLYMSNLSPLTSGQQLAVAGNSLQDTFSQAMGGDATALANLPTAARDFLTISRTFFASAPEYTAAFQQVIAMLEAAKSIGTLGGATSTTVSIPGYADGLDRVPYDNYLMYTHRDEAVLTSTEAADWRSGKGGISAADLAALRADVQRLTAVVMAGDQANVAATRDVSATTREIANRQEAAAVLK